jgi:hypothetical protein
VVMDSTDLHGPDSVSSKPRIRSTCAVHQAR